MVTSEKFTDLGPIYKSLPLINYQQRLEIIKNVKGINKIDGLLTDNIVWYNNQPDIDKIIRHNHSSDYYNSFTKKIKKNYIGDILKCLYIVEIIMRRTSFSEQIENYSQYTVI